jgi:hypothetical protein
MSDFSSIKEGSIEPQDKFLLCRFYIVLPYDRCRILVTLNL